MSIQVTRAAAAPARTAVRPPSEPVDARLRGRDSQGGFGRGVWKRIRDLYPK